MKKILSLLIVTIFAAIGAFGQLQPAPGVFNYQGVARNSVGNVLANQIISLRLTIRDASPGGSIVYQETRTVATNPFGLFNVQVGSPGATGVSGSIQPLSGGLVTPSPWATATGLKYIQVEIDPSGGTTFINIGTAQIASVPFALYSSLSNDLVLPYNKTQADAGTLFRIVNSGTGVSGSIMGVTNSGAANAWGVHGRVDNPAAGGFSSGILGTNLSTTGNGIGVTGSQNGSGWGVYGTTPSGIGVYGLSASGTGVQGASTSGYGVNGTSSSSDGVHGTSTSAYGVSGVTSASNAAGVLGDGTGTGISSGVLGRSGEGSYPGIAFNSGVLGRANANIGVQGLALSGIGVYGNSSTGRSGFFENTNAANGADALQASTNGTASSWAFRATSTGLQGAGIFTYNNPAGVAATIRATNNGGGFAVSAATTGTNSAGSFQNSNAANTTPTVNIASNATSGTGILSTMSGTGQVSGVSGFISSTAAASAGVVGADFSSGGASPVESRTYGVLGQTGTTGIAVGGYALAGGTALRGSGGGVTGFALSTSGNVRMTGIGEAANRILATIPGNGDATWVSPSAVGVITGSGTLNFVPKWTPSGTNLGNSLLFDNGTSMGLGTTTPSHRLDVSHTGSTGIGVNSSSGFSVVDINAASGDAALRFANAGVNQWNMRNRPSDNYLEIFELGGGGSRVVIQDGTGNVGIGQTVAPSYKLDVLHGGSTGLRVQSSASFSVVDIDAASGDAALRFANNGVNQWNIRNRPADDYLEIFELGGGGSRVVIQDATGNVGIGQTTAPAYKLDVLHGGSTGLRVQSSASFSVVDIDGNSGDAALRFVKAGANQWNIRNRPADDYLEIFELGGGGSRVVIQDATGNVGIGQTTAPAYKLDVLHGGSTGLRVQSSASFSVVDIDGNSGDAALRFIKAGVNKWNTRNEPVNDDYQWFELGGGGERMRIQRGTGNVGINNPAPSYKLDVEHGGATGLRVQSSASFSVVDIDGNSGDAALRFVRAGVNQWNTRNNPGTDDYQIFELGGGGERLRIENTTGRVVVGTDLHVTGTLSKGGGAFKIDHPLDPANKYLWHSFVESPDMMNIYNGNIVTDATGKATVQLPDYFEALNMEFRYQLTVIGSFAQAIISKEVAANKFEIATSTPNVKVSWQVTGVRHDPYAQAHRIPNAIDKEAANKGKYLHPELYNQPLSKAIGYTDEKNSSLDYVAPVNANKVAPATTGGSLDYTPAVTNKVAPPTTGGSLDYTPTAPATKPASEVKGTSVEDVKVAEKKAEVKPVEVKGTSVEDVPNKPVEEKKKISNVPESTKTD